METDLLGDSVPAARALRQGHVTPDDFLFRGPGYALLLAGSTIVTRGDDFLAAQLLNLAATAAAATAAYLMVRAFLGAFAALLTTLALLANPVFVRAAIEAGSDMPALALALGATWLALRRGGWASFAAAGFLAGCAFVTRYNMVFLIPAALIALGRGAARRGLAYAAGLALTLGPWMILLNAMGHPMRNQNFLNVAYEVYGRGLGWDRFWVQTGGTFASFMGVVRYDPARFALHVARNFATRWMEDARRLMPVWIGALALPGLVLTCWRRPGGFGFALHFIACYLLLTLVFYTPRFFLYLLPFYLSGAIGLLLWPRLRPAPEASTAEREAHRWAIELGPVVVAILLAASAVDAASQARKLLSHPPEETRVAGALLRGIGRPGERIMARKPHVGYFAGVQYVPLTNEDSFTNFLAALERSRADYLFISGIECSLQPQLEVLADSGVALPGLRPLAHGGGGGKGFFSLYRVVPLAVPVEVIEDSLLGAIRKFAARRPGAAWPAAYLGGHLVTMGRYREALAPLAEAERLNPADGRVARFQAIAHAELGEYDPAAAACERSARLTPVNDWALAYLGHIRLEQDRADEARELLREALVAAPTNARYLSEYLRACDASGASEQGAAVAEQILRARPDDAPARLLGARAWVRSGHPERARALAELPGPVSGPDSANWIGFAEWLRKAR